MILIDTVYQKVLALANKEQRGYVTPQEFNLLADRAQKEIFENYFHDIKTAQMKPKNQTDYADDVEMIEEKLGDFIATITAWSSTPTFGLSGDIYKLISIQRNGNEVTELNQKEILYTENNPLTKATKLRSTFVRQSSGIVVIYPTPTVDTDFQVIYYKKPITPSWGYVVVNEKALYNSNASTDFELHASEEESLISRILILSGTTIKQPDLQQAGAQDIQLINQQQNS